MVHGDDKGLVLPPAVAPLQVVIVPITSKKYPMEKLAEYCKEVADILDEAGVRVKFDSRDHYSPGWKYNHWEQKGVCIRLEVGPRDFDNRQLRACIRYSGEKVDVPIAEIATYTKSKLPEIQDAMFAKVKKERDDCLVRVTEWKDFVPNLEKGNLILTPWCGPDEEEWEEHVKEKSKAEAMKGETEDAKCAISVAGKTLCIPFEQPDLPEGTKCFVSGLPATCWCLWGRSY